MKHMKILKNKSREERGKHNLGRFSTSYPSLKDKKQMIICTNN